MSELLLELFSEEIPARLQTRAADDLRRLMVDGLKAAGLEVGEARAFATPRRLALVIEGVPKKSPAVSEEKKGPRVGAPEQAVRASSRARGSRRSRGGDRQGREEGRLLRRAYRQAGPRRGRDRQRGAARDVLNFPWPKTMRFNARLETAPSCAGSGRCSRSCCCSTARWCRSRSPASRPAAKRAAIASSATSRSRSRASPTTRRSSKQHKVVLDPADAHGRDQRAGARARQGSASSTLVEDDALPPRTPGSPSGRSC